MSRSFAFLLTMGMGLLVVGPVSAADNPKCEQSLTAGTISDLVAGASLQRIELTASCPLRDGDYSLYWRGTRLGKGISKDAGRKLSMTLEGLPADLPRGELPFQLRHDQSTTELNLVLRVGEIVTSRGIVSYSDSGAQRSRGQDLAADSRLPIAVVNPTYGLLAKRVIALREARRVPDKETSQETITATEKTQNSVRISNRAFLMLPPSLANLPGDSSWTADVIEPVSLLVSPKKGEKLSDPVISLTLNPAELARGISYVVAGEQTTRLNAILTLTMSGGDKEPWLKVPVALADSARAGLGQPLPIFDVLYVACQGGAGTPPSDIAFNGGTHAIRDGALAEGRCFLYVDPCNQRPLLRGRPPEPPTTPRTEEEKAAADTKVSNRTQEVLAKYNLFGAQSLIVSVERVGISGRWEGRWILEPSKWACEARKETRKEDGPRWWNFLLDYEPVKALPLSIPAGDPGDGDAAYTIQVRGAAWTPNVQYTAGSTAPPESAGTPLLAPDYQFTARLRPPGPFGFAYYRGAHGLYANSIRMFLTIPVEGVAFRFPARLRDLSSTSDNPRVEVLSLRAGVLLTVEPWDYNRGKNPFWVPLRLQGGMHLVDLGRGAFAPSTLLGISAALPFLDGAPKFAQTSVGVGMFWENDLRDRSNHFLLTIGLNLGSLFSPAAGKSN